MNGTERAELAGIYVLTPQKWKRPTARMLRNS